LLLLLLRCLLLLLLLKHNLLLLLPLINWSGLLQQLHQSNLLMLQLRTIYDRLTSSSARLVQAKVLST
jgi:hypothetical protein